MSLNFITHAVVATLLVAFLAGRTWTRLLMTWPPHSQTMRMAVAGLLLLSLGSIWWVMATGPRPWFYLAAPGALYILAFSLGVWIRARSPQG